MLFVYQSIYAQAYGSNSLTQEDKDLLIKYHNAARAEIGNPPLTWSNELEAGSVQCMKELAPTEMKHGICKGIPAVANVGENLAIGTGMTGAQAALMFIGEKCGNGGDPSDLNHYTQVVWKDTKTMSCAKSQGSMGPLIYCHYSPPGNIIGNAYGKRPANADCNGAKFDEAKFKAQAATAQVPKAAGPTAPVPATPVPVTDKIATAAPVEKAPVAPIPKMPEMKTPGAPVLIAGTPMNAPQDKVTPAIVEADEKAPPIPQMPTTPKGPIPSTPIGSMKTKLPANKKRKCLIYKDPKKNGAPVPGSIPTPNEPQIFAGSPSLDALNALETGTSPDGAMDSLTYVGSSQLNSVHSFVLLFVFFQ